MLEATRKLDALKLKLQTLADLKIKYDEEQKRKAEKVITASSRRKRKKEELRPN